MRETDTHIFFWDGVFSNWYECIPNYIKYDGLTFFTSEQAFMWEKAIYFGDIRTAKEILKTPSPKVAKELGREVKNFNAKIWSQVSYDIMVKVNLFKYRQNVLIKDRLLSTEDKIIVEASPTDSIWGIGLHWSDDRVLDESKWMGQNLLGKVLMEIRDRLRNERVYKA